MRLRDALLAIADRVGARATSSSGRAAARRVG